MLMDLAELLALVCVAMVAAALVQGVVWVMEVMR